uniref:Uncharacterized protein n=1 Tax=Clytia hemisphaerica TaxID=252671 RepID=A0A7M5V6V8_9CNID
GGWLVIGNITVEENAQDYIDSLYVNHIRSSSTIDQLDQTSSGKFMINPKQFRNLLKVDGYDEIRVRCFKPWHQRIVDVVVYGNEAINDFITESKKYDGLCSQIRYLPDDRSLIQNFYGCNQVLMWNGENYWDHFIYVDGKVHIILVEFNGRFECDDRFNMQGFEKKGNWIFYVR